MYACMLAINHVDIYKSFLWQENHEREEMNLRLTWEIPGVVFVNVQLPDELDREWALLDLPFQVEQHELFISRVETEPRQYHLLHLLTLNWRSHLDWMLINSLSSPRSKLWYYKPWLAYAKVGEEVVTDCFLSWPLWSTWAEWEREPPDPTKTRNGRQGTDQEGVWIL